MFLGPIAADTIGAEYRDLWNELALKYHMPRSFHATEFRETIFKATQWSVKTPLELATLTKNQTLALGKSLFTNGVPVALWKYARCQFDHPENTTAHGFHKGPKIIPRLIKRPNGSR